MRIPNKFNGYSADNRRLYFLDMGGGGGGGGGTTTATTYSSNVPEYAKQPFMEMIGKAEALTQAPYQAYTGERVAQFSPLQQQAYGAAAGQQVAGQLAPATGLAMGAGLGGLSQQSFIQPGMAGAYMSPFMEQALMPQITAAQKQSRLAGQQQAAEAVGRGAFGGTRDAIMRAEREKSLMGQIGDIRSKGYQTAFEQAQNQFNQEQAQRLQGLQLAGQAAGTLGTLGQQQFGQQMGITEQQSQLGAQQRQAMQDILNQRYSDFQAQRDYPYQQIGFMSDLLRGAGGSTRTVYPGVTTGQQLLGLGSSAYGISKMFGAAEGGEVPYAEGGEIDAGIGRLARDMEFMPNQVLQQKMQAAGVGDLKAYLAAKLVEQKRAELAGAVARQGALQAPPVSEQPTVVEQDLQGMGLASVAPESVGAIPDGGIAGYEDGGEVGFEAGGLMAPWWSPAYVRAANESELSGLELEELRRRQAREAGVREDPAQSILRFGVADPTPVVAPAAAGARPDDAAMLARRFPATAPTPVDKTSAATAPSGKRASTETAGLGSLNARQTTRTPVGAGAAPTAGIPALPPSKVVEQERALWDEQVRQQREIEAQRAAERKANRPGSETFAERKALLEEDLAKSGEAREMAKGEAALAFAEAVMQPAGRSTLTALVNGMTAGGKQMAAANKELKKAEREHKLGLAALAESERAAKRGDYDAQEKFDLEAQARIDKYRDHGVAAIAKGYQTDRAEALKVWEVTAEQLGAQQREHIRGGYQLRSASIGASARGAGGQNRVMQEFGDIQAKVMDNLSKNVKYQAARDPAVKSKMFQDELALAVRSNPFLKDYAKELLGSSAPAGGQRTISFTDIK